MSNDRHPDLSRFCAIIPQINELNEKLQKAAADFYDGGHSFEECNSIEIEERNALQVELGKILNARPHAIDWYDIEQTLMGMPDGDRQPSRFEIMQIIKDKIEGNKTD